MTPFKIPLLLILLAGLLTAGCSRGLFSIHTIDIQQGNALAKKDMDKIQTGMSRQDVEHILGSPVLTPLFSPDRWDYVYFLKKPDTPPEEQRLSVYFSADRVVKVER